jgi:hypothetical protein
MRAQRQHVVRRGTMQDRVDRLEPSQERFGLGVGDLGLAVVFLKLVISCATALSRLILHAHMLA